MSLKFCALGLLARAAALRAPAYPLIVQSPLSLSVWQGSDNLTDCFAAFWGGQTLGYVGLIRIDGSPFRWMGSDTYSPNSNTPAAQQLGLPIVTATSTIYSFAAAGVAFNVSFTTPITADDIYTWMTNPVSYLQISVLSADGAQHAIELLFAHTAEATVNDVGTPVQWQRDTPRKLGGLQTVRIGSAAQDTLGQCGDRMRTSWGFHYLSVPDGSAGPSPLPAGPAGTLVKTAMAGSVALCGAFVANQALPADDTRQPRACSDEWPMIGVQWTLPNGSIGPSQGGIPTVVTAIMTYDEVYSMNYYGAHLAPFWTTLGDIGDMLARSLSNGTARLAASSAFDQQVWTEMMAAGGQQYAELAVLVHRQVYGAMTFTVPPGDLPYGCGYDVGGVSPLPGGAWAFMEEQSSDGDVSTVDVLYPASPAVLYFSPELQAALNLPVMEYARNCTPLGTNGSYLKPFAPHDLGTWPCAQRAWNQQEDMPVEESANLIILYAAAANISGSTSFLAPGHWSVLESWAQFVNTSLPTPPSQLCTDDFEGPAPNNTNLALKGITALGAWAQLLTSVGRASEAQTVLAWARSHVSYWLANAFAPYDPTTGLPAHYKRQYELNSSTYSLKYNSIYGYFLGLANTSSWLPDDVMLTEFAFYNSGPIAKPYGPPLDDRNIFTLVEYLGDLLGVAGALAQRGYPDGPVWQSWLTSVLWSFANDTKQRVPMTDWYNAATADQWGFQARATVGDIFALALMKNRGFGAGA